MDTSARNFVPDATMAGGAPCENAVVGCMDPAANNYGACARGIEREARWP